MWNICLSDPTPNWHEVFLLRISNILIGSVLFGIYVHIGSLIDLSTVSYTSPANCHLSLSYSIVVACLFVIWLADGSAKANALL